VAIVATEDGPDLLPSTIDLAGAEAMLLPRTGREYVLRTALEEIAGSYDDIMLDCAPSLGVLTINALTAADEVLIPLQCETLSHRGVGQLLDTVQDVQRLTNRGLRVRGVLPTLYDGRTNHAKMVIADVATRYGLPVLEPPIPKSVRFAEAPAAGHSVLVTARRAAGADAYRLHAKALLKPIPKTKSAPKPVAAKAPAPKDAVAPPASPEASAPAQPERAPRRRVSA
jgi:chromosome partitioning protein